MTGRDADDQGLRTAVGKELPHGVRHGAVTIESAIAALEIGKAGDHHRLVRNALSGESDEGRDGRRHARDCVHAAGFFLDVDSGITNLHHSGLLDDRKL
jgi:hypothetical protein